MKTKPQPPEVEVPFDPVLFAAMVPSRKPTAKDLKDCEPHPKDLIEPKDFRRMEDVADDL